MKPWRALAYLLRTRFKNRARAFLWKLRRPGPLLATLAMVAFAAFMVWGTMQRPSLPGADPVDVLATQRNTLAMVLGLLLTLSFFASIGQEGITFSPADLEFLFPGPFKRYQLILYWLVAHFGPSLMAACIFWLFFGGVNSPHPAWMFVGLALFQTVSMHLGIVGAQLGVVIADKWAPGIRRVIKFAGIAVGLLFAGVLIAMFAGGDHWRELIGDIATVDVLKVLWCPAYAASDLGYVAGTERWIAIGTLLAASAGLLGVVLLSNVDWRESSFATSQANAQKAASVKRGGAATSDARARRSKLAPTRWQGAWAIVWRDWLTLLRRPRTMLGGVLGIVVLIAIGATSSSESGLGKILVLYLAIIPYYLNLPLGFRVSREDYETYRLLPVAGQARAVAMATITAFAAWAIQVAATVIAVATGLTSAQLGLAACIAFLPLNYTMVLADGWMQARNPGATIGAGSIWTRILTMFLTLIPMGIGAGATYAITDNVLLAAVIGGIAQTLTAWALVAWVGNLLDHRDWSAAT